MKKENCGEFLERLGMNGNLWAKEFIEKNKERDLASDEGAMNGWFANAIMAGYDKGRKPAEGSFMWAVEQMKQGKKVRRKNRFDNKKYIFAKGLDIEYVLDAEEAKYQLINLEDFEATDWEIYQEKKCDLRGQLKAIYCWDPDVAFCDKCVICNTTDKIIDEMQKRLLADEHINSDGEVFERIKKILGEKE